MRLSRIVGRFALLGLLVAGSVDVALKLSARLGGQTHWGAWTLWIYPSVAIFAQGGGTFWIVLAALQNALLYGVIGVPIGLAWVRLRPDKATSPEHSAR